MIAFTAETYGSILAELLSDTKLPPLGPGSPDEAQRQRLSALTPAQLFAPAAVKDGDMARACLAGLWLYHDFLDESHTISQEIDTPTGSYWHGIMHRREPDFSNAGYWFRRVGQHPIFDQLGSDAVQLTTAAGSNLFRDARWDPFRFIDACEACLNGQSPHELLCRQLQRREWELLFDFCWRSAQMGR